METKKDELKTYYIEQIENAKIDHKKYIDQIEACEKAVTALDVYIRHVQFELRMLDMPPRRKGKAAYRKWARSLYDTCGSDTFEAGLKYADTPNLEVVIEKTSERGPVEWAIMPESEPGFWLDAFKTKKEAIAFCKEMGWRV